MLHFKPQNLRIGRRLAGRLAGVALAATALVTLATATTSSAAPAAAGSGSVGSIRVQPNAFLATTDSGGPAVNVRSGPSTSFGVRFSLANHTTVTVNCQVHGQSVTGHFGTSDIWDFISASPGSGWAADVNINTGSNGIIQPC